MISALLQQAAENALAKDLDLINQYGVHVFAVKDIVLE